MKGIGPKDAIGKVARRVMAQRLNCVIQYLPLAALEADADVEYVHQLRVWSRRSAAAYAVFRDELPPKRRAWLKKRLRAIRRAAGPARDDDVLALRLQRRMHAEPSDGLAELLGQVVEHRRQAQADLVQLHDTCAEDQVFDRFDAIVRKIRWRGDASEPTFLEFARPRLAEICQAFFAAAGEDLRETAELHHLRIEGKRLRYAIELFAPAFPAGLKKRVYPQIGELQEILGSVNDHAVAAARFRDWRAQADSATSADTLAALIDEEDRQFAEQRDQFFTWWTAERREELARALGKYSGK